MYILTLKYVTNFSRPTKDIFYLSLPSRSIKHCWPKFILCIASAISSRGHNSLKVVAPIASTSTMKRHAFSVVGLTTRNNLSSNLHARDSVYTFHKNVKTVVHRLNWLGASLGR